MPVLGDDGVSSGDAVAVDRVIACSGKVYFDLLEHRRKTRASNVAIVRLEQLYPFPASRLETELSRYPNARGVVWCQEEASNQGAWRVLEPELRALVHPAWLRYAGPPPAASTAPGGASGHVASQAALVKSAFED